MHDEEEIGTATYDFRKLFAKKNLKFSTWLDLDYEEKVVGKLGCCIWLEVDDFMKDITDDIMHRVNAEVERIYKVEKLEDQIEHLKDLDIQ